MTCDLCQIPTSLNKRSKVTQRCGCRLSWTFSWCLSFRGTLRIQISNTSRRGLTKRCLWCLWILWEGAWRRIFARIKHSSPFTSAQIQPITELELIAKYVPYGMTHNKQSTTLGDGHLKGQIEIFLFQWVKFSQLYVSQQNSSVTFDLMV